MRRYIVSRCSAARRCMRRARSALVALARSSINYSPTDFKLAPIFRTLFAKLCQRLDKIKFHFIRNSYQIIVPPSSYSSSSSSFSSSSNSHKLHTSRCLKTEPCQGCLGTRFQFENETVLFLSLYVNFTFVQRNRKRCQTILCPLYIFFLFFFRKTVPRSSKFNFTRTKLTRHRLRFLLFEFKVVRYK